MKSTEDLKQKTLRGASMRLFAQGASFLLRVVSLMVLARLLKPDDFGLVGMVTAITGVLSLFRDFGLSAATVQRVSITDAQASTLFWLNGLVGAILTVVALASAPAIAAFYHQPHLIGVTFIVAAGFFFNGFGVQHSALLQRQMRFTSLATIELISLVVSTIVAIVFAKIGFGYWALAWMTLCAPIVSTVGLWVAARWVPGLPRRGAGIRSMLRFGGTVTLNGLVIYVGSNFEKILLGRFWGAEAIGIYGRAYQLIRMPIDSLNFAVGEVAFSALSRLQGDHALLKRYFLRGYSLVLVLTLPITFGCALFANDLIAVLLGPKWQSAAQIFRLLAPTILAFAILNPMGWLMNAMGLVGRGLKIALVLAPTMIAGYAVGLPYGPRAVAISYSVVMMFATIPLLAWAIHNTPIGLFDVFGSIARPLASICVASIATYGASLLWGEFLASWLHLFVELTILFVIYGLFLAFVFGDRTLYSGVVRGLFGRAVVPKNATSI
jgi:O-antigen/teichoic acid export membrane protein